MKRIYAIQTGLNRAQNTQLVHSLEPEDEKSLMTLEFQLSLDLVDDEDKLTTIAISNIISIEKLKSFLTKKEIKFQVEDITYMFSKEEDDEKITSDLESITEEDILKKLGVEV